MVPTSSPVHRRRARNAVGAAITVGALLASAGNVSGIESEPGATFNNAPEAPTRPEAALGAAQDLVDTFRASIAAKLGSDVPGPMTVRFGIQVDDDANAQAHWTGGRYSACTITFSAVSPDADDIFTLAGDAAHEVFHCFEAAHRTEAAWEASPDWITEGGASWAASDLTADYVLPNEWWQSYLTEPGTPLFDRTYDGIGFFAHLAETTANPWTVFEAMWAAPDSAAAFDASGANGNVFMDSWASGVSRQPQRGAAWDTSGPSITDDAATPESAEVSAGAAVALTTPAYTNRLVQLSVVADVITVQSSGFARMSDGTLDVPRLAQAVYCTKEGGCGTCPDGSPLPGNPAQLGKAPLVALSSSATVTSATFTGLTVEDYCDEGNPVWVHLERPAMPGVMAGTVLELYGCDGPLGAWTGVFRLGGLDAGDGFVVDFVEAPVSFVLAPGSPTTQTTVNASVPTPVGPVDVTFSLEITVTEATMAITGTATGDTGVVAVEQMISPEIGSLPIEPAPDGSCL